MAATLKRCYDKQTHFRKKISVEEQRAQKVDQFFRRETNCLFDVWLWFVVGNFAAREKDQNHELTEWRLPCCLVKRRVS